MNIKVIAVGKIKERYIKDVLEEYVKRLTPFCGFSVIEVNAEQINDDSLCDKYKKAEAQKILCHIKDGSFIITLEIDGIIFSSDEFARKISFIANEGYNEIVFIIGGANGLDKQISNMSHLKLSFSKMTFTHQMARVILFEQIYRAFKINNNERYHR